MLRWSTAMSRALYGPDGFYTTQRPRRHFRTSAQSPLFAEAIAVLVRRLDDRLGHPDPFTVLDMGAGDGELLANLLSVENLSGRLRTVGVELRPRPDGLDPRIDWRDTLPEAVTGLVLACEWLDTVPCDVAETTEDGSVHYQLVDPATGETALGPAVDAADADWLARWWPSAGPGTLAEIGRPRDAAWQRLRDTVTAGTVLAVDYGHLRDHRPRYGTLTGYAAGRQVPAIPDGSCDITAHVAVDALPGAVIVDQRTALRALGITGRRPEPALARTDPMGYLRALDRTGRAAELTDPAGLGGHHWCRADH